MKRIICMLFFFAAALGLTGCDASQLGGPTSPEAVPAGSSAPADLTSSPVIAIANGVRTGESRLGRDLNRVGVAVHTNGIPNNQALTLWWVVFNNPQACATAPCNEQDLGNPAVEADILYAAGSVVSGGRASFNATLREGETAGSIAGLFGLPAASGLHDALTAEVHVVVRSHGPVIPNMLEEQLNSYGGGCSVELAPGTMPSAEGECADIQFAIHSL